MNNTKQVILVFPRFKYPNGDIPIGLASLAATVKSKIKHINVSVIDGGFTSLDRIKNIFWSKRPGIVGIYMDSSMCKDALKVADFAKGLGANVIIGGPHPTVLPETVIVKDSVDAVCIGEGENVLPDYVENYYNGKDFSKIKGIWFKYGKEIIRNETQCGVVDLDTLPRLDLGMFEVEKYIKNWIYMNSYSPKLRGISVIASRGCGFNCSYCQPVLDTMFGKKLRICSPEKMIYDLIYWRDKYKLQAFYFQDDTLTLFSDWLKEFCNLAISKKLCMVWACNSRVDTINSELIGFLKQAGCKKVRFGIETSSDRVLNDIYNKKISLDRVRGAVSMAKKNKIQASGYFMLGGPTESEKEIRNTINFAGKSGLDEAVFTIFSPIPGTYLYSGRHSKNGCWPEKSEDLDYYKAKRVKIISPDMSNEKLNFYKKLAFLIFYCHPKRLRKTLAIVLNRYSLLKILRSLKTYF